MPNSHTEVYVHYIWATWDRQPLITPDIESALYDCIRARCRDMQAHLHAIGGVADHIHVLVRLPAALSIAQVAKDLKGASSHFVTHALGQTTFRWQGAYSAFGACADAFDPLCAYIANQKQHRSSRTTRTNWEMPAD